MQALQIIGTNRDTGCHLGTCVAIRLSEAVPLVNSSSQHGDEPDSTKFAIKQVDCALRTSGLGKRSKQRFLNVHSKDSQLKKSRRGTGGNTVPYSCIIIRQSALDSSTVECFQRGKLIYAAITSCKLMSRPWHIMLKKSPKFLFFFAHNPSSLDLPIFPRYSTVNLYHSI